MFFASARRAIQIPMALSEFEKQRQQNIARNKELLRKLELDSLTDSIGKEARALQPTKKRKTTPKPRVKKETPEPTRRSRRLRGVELDNNEAYQKRIEEEEKALREAERRTERLEMLRHMPLYGDFKLIDLVTDRKGNLKHEDRVRPEVAELKRAARRNKAEPDVKVEEVVEVKSEEEVEIDSDDEVLQILRKFDRVSNGDFYEVIRDRIKYDDSVLEEKRNEFDNKNLLTKYDDVRITHERISTIDFHGTTTDRLVAAGDKVGNVGIWAVDQTDAEGGPTVAILRPHGRAVVKVLSQDASLLVTASNDGSVRTLDLGKMQSLAVLHATDDDETLAITDVNLSSLEPNLIYITTMGGQFYRHDLRTLFKAMNLLDLWRLHDKKAGGFCINPNASHQIASGSLDRTLRVWDLRKVDKATWSEFENQRSPHIYGTFVSRLSISSVDWNINNRLVCNGYANRIHIFDLDGGDKVVSEWDTSYRPNAKADDELPNNLEPVNNIMHNCQTGRWVSILKSRWQRSPADGVQKFVIGNMNRGMDVYDENGKILAHLADPDVMLAVPAVADFHPSENWVVGGTATGKIYLFE